MDLPKYESVRLRRSPLVLVVAQINFEDTGSDVSHAQAREIQRVMGNDWTRLQVANQVRATITPTGAVNELQRRAYQLATQDGSWSLLVNPDSVNLETRAYTGWTDLAPKFRSAAEAVAKVFDPAQQLRLGLRYVDQVPLPDGRTSWDGLIPDSLLGLVQHPVFGACIIGAEHRSLLALPGTAKGLFRHGQMDDADKGQVYLLDYDVFDDASVPFAADHAAEAAEQLHQYAGSLFRVSVTDDLYARLKD